MQVFSLVINRRLLSHLYNNCNKKRSWSSTRKKAVCRHYEIQLIGRNIYCWGASVETTDAVLNLKGRRHIGMQDQYSITVVFWHERFHNTMCLVPRTQQFYGRQEYHNCNKGYRRIQCQFSLILSWHCSSNIHFYCTNNHFPPSLPVGCCFVLFIECDHFYYLFKVVLIFFLVWSFVFVGTLYLYTKYYVLVIYHVLNFVMINKGCLVFQTMPGFLSFVDLDIYWMRFL